MNNAIKYELHQQLNNSAWTASYNGGAQVFNASPDASGSYKYRVRACDSIGCSGWKVSGVVTLTTSQSPDWKNTQEVTVTNAAGSNTAPSETIDLTAAVLKGQAGVSGGQASYQIPIDLPPGRNGIQPRVSLSYSSQGGNGTAGVGWSLNAGTAISRCGATYAQDGFTRAVTFSADTDRLCFNGQRLITSGSYGTSGTEYRTEMDSFVRVVQSGGD